jgi:hypothetical protein
MQKLLDQIDVCQHHPSAAIPLKAKLCQRHPFVFALHEQSDVCVPLIADHLAAREAANGNDLSREWEK